MDDIYEAWPTDTLEANRQVREAAIAAFVAVTDFLNVFFLWAFYTAVPATWKLLQVIWTAILAIRWGVPRMWRELTVGANVSSIEQWRQNALSEAIAEELADVPFSPMLDRAPMDPVGDGEQ